MNLLSQPSHHRFGFTRGMSLHGVFGDISRARRLEPETVVWRVGELSFARQKPRERKGPVDHLPSRGCIVLERLFNPLRQ